MPVATVASAYAASSIAHPLDGFGCLVPRKEQRRILGVLFSSTMFDGRAPAGTALLTTFIGGQRHPDLPALPEADIAALAHAEHGALLGARAAPRFQSVTRWPRAIPQYTLGHLGRVARAEAATRALPGLFLCASWRGGVSVGDCIKNGHPRPTPHGPPARSIALPRWQRGTAAGAGPWQRCWCWGLAQRSTRPWLIASTRRWRCLAAGLARTLPGERVIGDRWNWSARASLAAAPGSPRCVAPRRPVVAHDGLHGHQQPADARRFAAAALSLHLLVMSGSRRPVGALFETWLLPGHDAGTGGGVVAPRRGLALLDWCVARRVVLCIDRLGRWS
jgi:hypothetical protein